MKRITITPRENWQQKVEQVGLTFHSADGVPYWDESACYRFTTQEIDLLEAATEELQKISLAAGQYIIDKNRFADLRIPEDAWPVIRQAWEAEPPSIYGRFDLSWNGVDPPKLLEYNANTPTSLLEASVVQWHWRQEVFPATDQFNSIHEKLIAKWSELRRYLRADTLQFACMPIDEDIMTITYLRDTAQQAGIKTDQLFIRDIGWNQSDATFRDLTDQPIGSIFSLYPWEWLLTDFATPILSTYTKVDWIEPIWKMMWANKGLLAILWEMFPGHPNLLPAFFDTPRGMRDWVKKPLLSREGANLTIHANGKEITTEGPYGREGFIYQQLAPGWHHDQINPVIGSWYITDQGAAGIGLRESPGITDNLSRFVPHYFD